jgi:RNase P/RNase MRP subunit p29
MTRVLTGAALLLLLTGPALRAAEGDAAAAAQILPPVTDPVPIVVRPAMLSDHIAELAGHSVQVASARVVRVYGTNALVVETSSRLRGTTSGRVLVILDRSTLRVPAAQLRGETVQVRGTARTLLGLQVSGDGAWPDRLDRWSTRRLDIGGAVLASSVHTADGVELTTAARQ